MWWRLKQVMVKQKAKYLLKNKQLFFTIHKEKCLLREALFFMYDGVILEQGAA
jgi:hypothetical protein